MEQYFKREYNDKISALKGHSGCYVDWRDQELRQGENKGLEIVQVEYTESLGPWG